MNPKIAMILSPFKGFYQSAVALSLDYETSAPYGDLTTFNGKIRGKIYRMMNKMFHLKKDLSFCYGLGYAMRHGAENTIKLLQKYGILATWFSNGHALLKNNKDGKAFRINQILPYAIPEAGFTDIVTWRKDRPTFFYEPKSDYKKYPYWYLGDQAAVLKEIGEDIQCHTFSHPYMPLEDAKNIAIDLEDWQNAAVANGFQKAHVLALPFYGDAYRYYYELGLQTTLGKEIAGKKYRTVCLSNEIIQIMLNNGIELITRCGSKIGELKNFSTYNDSELYYMSDMDLYYCHGKSEPQENRLSKIVENGSAVNIWLHPSDIFVKERAERFEALIRSLIDRMNKNEIWLATISQIWDHFKKVRACDLNVTLRNRRDYDVVVVNNTASVIEDVGIIVNPPGLMSVRPSDNLEQQDGKILVRKLQPNAAFKIAGQLRR